MTFPFLLYETVSVFKAGGFLPGFQRKKILGVLHTKNSNFSGDFNQIKLKLDKFYS